LSIAPLAVFQYPAGALSLCTLVFKLRAN